MTTAWEKFLEKNPGTPFDMLNPKTKRVDDNISSERFSICQSCEFFIKLSGQCTKCGCFMKAKTTIESATCPENKW